MYYFVSDIHLGLGTPEESAARERLFIRWINEVSADAEAIFIVGDLFDFWYEYRRVVPKGFTRLLGTLSALTDRGAKIHFFPGNHDLWSYDYLYEECGVIIHNTPLEIELNGKKTFITHGDDITAQEKGFLTRMMNSIFRNRGARWAFSHFVHPDVAMLFGLNWSSSSRKSKAVAHRFLAEEEPMVRFARRYASHNPINYFVFGHNHCAQIHPLNKETSAVFLGEWIENPTYATLSCDGNITLLRYPQGE